MKAAILLQKEKRGTRPRKLSRPSSNTKKNSEVWSALVVAAPRRFPSPHRRSRTREKINGRGGAVRKNNPKRTPKREGEGYQATELACASVYQRSRNDKKSEKKKRLIRSPDKRRGPTSVLHGVCDTAVAKGGISYTYIYIYAPKTRKKRISKGVLNSERSKRPASFLCPCLSLSLCVCVCVFLGFHLSLAACSCCFSLTFPLFPPFSRCVCFLSARLSFEQHLSLHVCLPFFPFCLFSRHRVSLPIIRSRLNGLVPATLILFFPL